MIIDILFYFTKKLPKNNWNCDYTYIVETPPNISLIAINANIINSFIKRLSNESKSPNPIKSWMQETHLTQINAWWWKIKGWTKVHNAKPISDKAEFKEKVIKQGRKDLCKACSLKWKPKTKNIYMSNSRAPTAKTTGELKEENGNCF